MGSNMGRLSAPRRALTRSGRRQSRRIAGAKREWPARRVSRGQALVEFALFVPLLLFMLVGATDVASLLNDHLTIIYATRTGARVGATLGTAPQADCAIVGSLQAALANDHNITLNRIVIFKSDANGNPIAANEDIYPGNATCTVSGVSATISPAASSLTWPPGSRGTTPFTEDSIGIEVDYSYNFQLNVLGVGSFTSYDRAVMPLEVVIGAPLPPSGVGQ